MIDGTSQRSVVIVASSAEIATKIGVPFAQHGIRVFLISRWTKTDTDAAESTFSKVDATNAILISCELDNLDALDQVFSKLALADSSSYSMVIALEEPKTNGSVLHNLTHESIDAALEAAGWSIFGALQAARAALGRYPRHALVVTISGSQRGSMEMGCSATDAGRAMLEVLCRFMATRLAGVDCRINLIRVLAKTLTGRIATETGNVAFALTSGRFDAMSGQIINIDQANVATKDEEPQPLSANLCDLELRHELEGRSALITGGTKGIGLATGLALGRLGAKVYLTHRWGSANEEAIVEEFRKVGALEPVIIEADASFDQDTNETLQAIARAHDQLEILVNNVAFAHRSSPTEDLSLRALRRSVGYSAWPLISYLRAAKRWTGAFPRYVISVSSSGVSSYIPAYEYVAASKAVLELLSNQVSRELTGEDVRVNVVRAWCTDTESLAATFGADFGSFVESEFWPGCLLDPEEVGLAIVGLCSGWMDSVQGETLIIDRGLIFWDSMGRQYEKRAVLTSTTD